MDIDKADKEEEEEEEELQEFFLAFLPTGAFATHVQDFLVATNVITGEKGKRTTPFVYLTKVFKERPSQVNVLLQLLPESVKDTKLPTDQNSVVERMELLSSEMKFALLLHSPWLVSFLSLVQLRLGSHPESSWAVPAYSSLNSSEPLSSSTSTPIFPILKRFSLPLLENFSTDKFLLLQTLASKMINVKQDSTWEVHLFRKSQGNSRELVGHWSPSLGLSDEPNSIPSGREVCSSIFYLLK